MKDELGGLIEDYKSYCVILEMDRVDRVFYNRESESLFLYFTDIIDFSKFLAKNENLLEGVFPLVSSDFVNTRRCKYNIKHNFIYKYSHDLRKYYLCLDANKYLDKIIGFKINII